MAQFPADWGMQFTPTIHSKPDGPTDPNNIKLPANFVVVVTGAGKGLGRQIALAYAKAGAKGIVISSRTKGDLDTLEAEVKKVNIEVEILSQTCDTQNGEQVKALAKATDEKFGRVDVVVSIPHLGMSPD